MDNPPFDLDLRAQLARIDRDRAETQKLIAEVQKLNAEARKFRWIDPLQVLAIILAALGISRFFGH